jgi:hypothetical protein
MTTANRTGPVRPATPQSGSAHRASAGYGARRRSVVQRAAAYSSRAAATPKTSAAFVTASQVRLVDGGIAHRLALHERAVAQQVSEKHDLESSHGSNRQERRARAGEPPPASPVRSSPKRRPPGIREEGVVLRRPHCLARRQGEPEDGRAPRSRRRGSSFASCSAATSSSAHTVHVALTRCRQLTDGYLGARVSAQDPRLRW